MKKKNNFVTVANKSNKMSYISNEMTKYSLLYSFFSS